MCPNATVVTALPQTSASWPSLAQVGNCRSPRSVHKLTEWFVVLLLTPHNSALLLLLLRSPLSVDSASSVSLNRRRAPWPTFPLLSLPMPRLSACFLLLALTAPTLHALTLPPECSLMDCMETCGFLPDGTVGCLPFTTPPTQTLPPECAAISCFVGSGCGVLADGSVGCIPLSTPPTKTLPSECAAIRCEFGSTCGLREDGTVGCIPGVLEQCPPDDFACTCTKEFNPTPCCKTGMPCEASNPCTRFARELLAAVLYSSSGD
jgi:hypothetical protein